MYYAYSTLELLAHVYMLCCILQYSDDRDKIKEAVKMRKVSFCLETGGLALAKSCYLFNSWRFQVSVLSTWTLEDFKNAIAEDISSPAISDVNLKV